MAKHAKEFDQAITNIGIMRTDETQTYKEAQQVMRDVHIIDESAKRHPIPPATVTE